MPTREVLLASDAVFSVTGTLTLAAVPAVKAGRVRSSSSPVLSSPFAVAFAGLETSPSVASVPMRMALLTVWLTEGKPE